MTEGPFKTAFDSDTDGVVRREIITYRMKNGIMIKEEAFSTEGREHIDVFLDSLPKWMVGVDVLWGHGYGFDITIIEDMLRQRQKPIPWQFWQVRDSRTLFSIAKVDPRKAMQTDLHNALADAYFQAKGVQMVYKELGVLR